MANFYVALSAVDIAKQIASLLNAHNLLTVRYTYRSIMSSTVSYYIEVIHSEVVGCAGIIQVGNEYCIKHVSVNPDHRQKGIAQKLIKMAMASVGNVNFFMTIRQDNIPSLRMASSLGFVRSGYSWRQDHYIITMRRQLNG